MERFLKANGITGTAYRTWTGNQTLKEFIAMNPGWTQRMWEELVLENIALLRRNG